MSRKMVINCDFVGADDFHGLLLQAFPQLFNDHSYKDVLNV